MGLFSFPGKNKQEGSSGESEFYSRAEEESQAIRGGAKRKRGKAAKTEPVDPVLPEKKRARRRLVGAVALVLAVIIGLPMILDSEPKSLPDDIAVQIPSKDKLTPATPPVAPAPLPQPEQANPTPDAGPGVANNAHPAASVAATPAAVPLVPAVIAATAPAATKADAKSADAKTADTTKAADIGKTAVADKSEPRPANPKLAEAKPAEVKPAPKAEQHAAKDDARAQAILEGKDVDAKPADAKKAGKFAVQVAALATQEKVDELRSKLTDAGFKSYTQKVPTTSGDRIRVRIGPFANKDEANSALAKLSKLGLNAKLVSS